jgi:hypothetical protein
VSSLVLLADADYGAADSFVATVADLSVWWCCELHLAAAAPMMFSSLSACTDTAVYCLDFSLLGVCRQLLAAAEPLPDKHGLPQGCWQQRRDAETVA